MFQHKLIPLGIFAFCAIVFCETKYICCPPEQWEGTVRSTYSILTPSGSFSTTLIDTSFSYDATLQMIAMRSRHTDEKGNFLFNHNVLQDFKTGIEYDLTAGPCPGTVIGKGNESCIPENTPILSHSEVGFGENVMETTTYWINSTDGSQRRVTVIDKNCTGLSDEEDIIVDGKVFSHMTSLYMDVKPGIKDPDVFNFPAYCGFMNSTVIDTSLSYDATLQMIAIRSRYTDEKGNFLFNHNVLQDFKTGIEYDLTAGPCPGTVIGKGNESCIPENTPILSHSKVGFGENVMETTTYWINSTDGTQRRATVIDKSCIGLRDEKDLIVDGKVFSHMTSLYMDVKPGIKDPDVFNFPAYCGYMNSTGKNQALGRRFARI